MNNDNQGRAVLDLRTVKVYEPANPDPSTFVEPVVTSFTVTDDGPPRRSLTRRGVQPHVFAAMAALAASSTPSPPSIHTPPPKPGPSKQKRAARKRQRNARKAARR